jgi:hypothetical protein
LPEPAQPAKKWQVITKRSKPFFFFLFAFFSQFTRICRELYYAFTTFDGASRVRRPTYWFVANGVKMLNALFGVAYELVAMAAAKPTVVT